GGVFHGESTTCGVGAGTCPQPGACCLGDGTCSSILLATCTSRTGTFRGEGAACATANCPAAYVEVGDAGETMATAPIVTGTGVLPGITGALGADETDVYSIQICDPANFRASTVTWTSGGQNGDPNGRVDTMLWLFRENGTGVEMTDDSPTLESTLSNAHVTQ